MRVLIVQSNPLVCRATSRALEREGWHTSVIGSDIALEALQASYDVILVEGAARFEEVARYSLRPVVVYTGTPEAVPEGVRTVQKPARIEILTAALRAAIEESKHES